MPWNSTWPVGNISVKANRIVGQQNTTYIETTMGNSPIGTNTTSTRDHFWAVGSDEDGRHRFIQSPAFTVGGNPADPVLGTGMDTVLYPKTTNGQVTWFQRNAQGIFQALPNILTGSANIPSGSSYSNVVAVPANVWGYIFLYSPTLNEFGGQTGFFVSNGSTVMAWATAFFPQSQSTGNISLKLGNGSEASGLNIRARRGSSAQTTWNYIVMYRAQ